MPESSRLRRLFVEVALALAILFLLLATLEGVVRLLWDDTPTPYARRASGTKAADHAAHTSRTRELPRLHRTSDLGAPNARGLNAGALYETNSAGFRGSETPRRTPPGVFRIAILGDSTAMGWGVELSETYAAKLERHLNATAGAPARVGGRPADSRERVYQVLNFGLAGLDAHGVARRFEDLALDFGPDLVIYGFTLNDIKGQHYRRSLDRAYAESLQRNDSSLLLWRALRPRWLALRELLFAPDGTYAGELDDNYFRNPAAWNDLRSHLQRIARLSDERSLCTVLLVNAQIQSLHALHPYRRHYDAVDFLAVEIGFHTVQSFDRLSREDARSLRVSPSDWHANARGHALVADILMETLAELPATCWERETNRSGASERAEATVPRHP